MKTLSNVVFMVMASVAIYLLLFPFKGSHKYYMMVFQGVCYWLIASSLWNILVATGVVVADHRRKRKIALEGGKKKMIIVSLFWMGLAAFLLYRYYTGQPLGIGLIKMVT